MPSDNANFFNLPADYSQPENSRVVIVPVPYSSANGKSAKGVAQGPTAVRDASVATETFDDELWVEPFKIGIHTAEPVKIKALEAQTEKPFSELTDVVSPLLRNQKFPIIVGGEHSLSIGAVRACVNQYPDLSILQIDSSTDFDDSFQRDPQASPYQAKSTAYHLYKLLPTPHITQVGIRNISANEAEWIENEQPNISTFWARNQDSWNMNEMLASLSDNVYLSIDVSALDSAVMPATKYSDPGGINWWEMLEIIKHVLVRKNVVAVDICEFSPIENLNAPALLVAKLIYKIVGYKYALDLGVTKKYL